MATPRDIVGVLTESDRFGGSQVHHDLEFLEFLDRCDIQPGLKITVSPANQVRLRAHGILSGEVIKVKDLTDTSELWWCRVRRRATSVEFLFPVDPGV